MSDSQYSERMNCKDIIQLFKSGKYIADLEEGTVSRANGTPVKPYVGNEEGHLFIRLYDTPKRKTIALHRAIWIAGTLSPIPRKFEIHHSDTDVKHNSFTNLYCLHELDHRKLHNGGLLATTDTVPF